MRFGFRIGEWRIRVRLFLCYCEQCPTTRVTIIRRSHFRCCWSEHWPMKRLRGLILYMVRLVRVRKGRISPWELVEIGSKSSCMADLDMDSQKFSCHDFVGCLEGKHS